MIVAQRVSKYYGSRRALDDVSFEIGGRQVVGFLGLNGAGKTTLLKILCGILVPSSGSVSVGGVDVLDDPRSVRRRVGFLPERPPLYPEMTVRSFLAYAGQLNGVAARAIAASVDEAIERCGLGRVADDLVAWLSHGFRQRLGIAQAIVHKPELVVLDEPISGLDPQQIVEMRALIRDLAEHHTVLLSSHILGEISQTCDRILVLHEGRIVAQGSEAELAEQAAAVRVEALVRGDAEAARRAAEGCEGTSGVRVEPGPQGRLRLTADVASEEARAALVRALVEAGLGVHRFAEAEAGLESVFLRLTARSGGAARGEA